MTSTQTQEQVPQRPGPFPKNRVIREGQLNEHDPIYIYLRLFFQPFAQFFMTGLSTVMLVQRNIPGIMVVTFISQLLWWRNIRQQRTTDHVVKGAPLVYAAGATVGAIASILTWSLS